MRCAKILCCWPAIAWLSISFLSFMPVVSSAQSDYKVIDTGQDKCFDDSLEILPPDPGDPFYGQDAQYQGVQPSYQDNGDGTVTDPNTGLMWQKTPDLVNKLTWGKALIAADTFTLAGHSDWRLPNIKALYSLIDFRGIDPSGYTGSDTSWLTPFIDTDYFDFVYGDPSSGERLIDAQYWSRTKYRGTTMNGDQTAFGVNFADGRIKGYPTRTGPGGDTMVAFVRFVRGNTNYSTNGFVDNNDGTVTDTLTGLMWQKNDSGDSLNWEQALAYAENLVWAGHNDWRLPNAKELQSIVDYTRSPDSTNSPAIDPAFDCTVIHNEAGQVDYPFYWTGTTHISASGPGATFGTYGVYVCFGRAMGYIGPPGQGTWMDVHGAGAQRSDPKHGDPANWPYGHGPQGDAVRIYHRVRCVRSGLTKIEEGDPGTRIKLSLDQNKPNPFNSRTVIGYAIPFSGNVKLIIYNAAGQAVRTLVDGTKTAGRHEAGWDGIDDRGEKLAPGIYFYRLQAGSRADTKQMVSLR